MKTLKKEKIFLKKKIQKKKKFVEKNNKNFKKMIVVY